MSQMLLFHSSFKLQLDSVLFSLVSNCARVSLTLSEEGYTEQGSDICFPEYGTCSFLIQQNVNLRVWADGETVD